MNNQSLDEQSLVLKDDGDTLVLQQEAHLIELVRTGTTVGWIEFLTGALAGGIDSPGSLVLSSGRLLQAAISGQFKQQLLSEVQQLRKKGKISNENLNTIRGKSLFFDLLTTLDEEGLGPEKIEALKAIFYKSVMLSADETVQMQAYEYFQVCRKLSSFDFLVLKTAHDLYLDTESRHKPLGSISTWDNVVSTKLGIARELVTRSRIDSNGTNLNSKKPCDIF